VYRDYSKERPVGDDVFAVYRRYFAYDRADLAAKLESTDERPEHWRVERVSFAAAFGGERILAQLFVPRNQAPPYQAVVLPAEQRDRDALERGARDDRVGFLVRSGRAVLFPTRPPSSAARRCSMLPSGHDVGGEGTPPSGPRRRRRPTGRPTAPGSATASS
jgi:hypothetical protein